MTEPLDTVFDLERVVRERFGDQLTDVDKLHIERWGSLHPDYAYSWFESLAYALNAAMTKGSEQPRFAEVVNFLSAALRTASQEVLNCIDVAFVENLFWQVSAGKAQASWALLPEQLKEFYLAFHSRPPV
jgi:hypothetical protein